MKFSKRTWLIISGCTWIGSGVMLLIKGLRFLVFLADAAYAQTAPLFNRLTFLAGAKQQAALLLICVALLIGFIKGRVILAKTVRRITSRIEAAGSSLTIRQVYDTKYYVILLVMVVVGLLFRFLPVPLDIRGVVDVAIGSALINGSMLYFREAVTTSYRNV